MPLHDWSRVPSGLFHHFHQHWSIEITTALNRGRLPKGLAALVEEQAGPKEPDVLAKTGFLFPTVRGVRKSPTSRPSASAMNCPTCRSCSPAVCM
jgi:hypothetical protein